VSTRQLVVLFGGKIDSFDSPSTFENISQWIDVLKIRNPCMGIVLVGNKSDEGINEGTACVDVNPILDHHPLPYFEVSAKTRDNVSQAFQEVVNVAYRLILSGQIEDFRDCGIQAGDTKSHRKKFAKRPLSS